MCFIFRILLFSFTIPPMTKPLALVTGGAQRLGKAFALTLARMGYDLLLHYHSADEQAQQTKAEIESLGVKVHLVQSRFNST